MADSRWRRMRYATVNATLGCWDRARQLQPHAPRSTAEGYRTRMGFGQKGPKRGELHSLLAVHFQCQHRNSGRRRTVFTSHVSHCQARNFSKYPIRQVACISYPRPPQSLQTAYGPAWNGGMRWMAFFFVGLVEFLASRENITLHMLNLPTLNGLNGIKPNDSDSNLISTVTTPPEMALSITMPHSRPTNNLRCHQSV